MTVYWIGDAVLILVVLPVVIILLAPVLRTARTINGHVDTIVGATAAASKDLDAVPLLLTTQQQVKVTVATVADFGSSLDTIIDDAGPGLNSEQAVRRGEGTGAAGSTGLGLDIVRKLAERVGGTLHTDRSPLGGLQVHVTLPTLEPKSPNGQQRTSSPWTSRVPRARRADRGAASR